MKKIFLIVAALTLCFSANAQTKAQIIKNLDKAKQESQNEKKATNPSTWLKLGTTYADAYKFPSKELWIGVSRVEVKILLKGQQIVSSKEVALNGVTYTVDSYEDKDLYYNAQGALEIIKVTKPVVEENLLDKSYEAFMKAHETDAKSKKSKEISEGLVALKENYINEAMAAYTFGDFKTACRYFEGSLKTTENPLVNKIDSLINYYTALTANLSGDDAKAIKYYEKCKVMGFEQKGDLYSSLAEVYKRQGKVDLAKENLNLGFQKFPTSQAILVSLINLYLETNDDPNKVLDLIRTAQKNEPTNASLYYAEGNVFKKLNDFDSALRCYYKSYEVDPTYVFGIYSVGSAYFDKAIEVQTKMDELDVADVKGYEKLLAQFEDFLLKAIDPFERAFSVTEDPAFRTAIADGLKQIYFRFRDKGDNYQQGYEKYNTYLQEHPSN